MRQYDFEHTPAIPNQCTPRQRRLLGDLGYTFRPGSYFYVPLDQADIISRTLHQWHWVVVSEQLERVLTAISPADGPVAVTGDSYFRLGMIEQ